MMMRAQACADAEIKNDLEYAISDIWENNCDRLTSERFHFILQVLLSDPEFFIGPEFLMS